MLGPESPSPVLAPAPPAGSGGPTDTRLAPAHAPHGATRLRRPAWWRAVRVRQWSKNALVLAAPVASGRVLEPQVLLGAVIAFAVFCAASAGCYLVNDTLDAEQDRLHPVKRLRPVAAREIRGAHALGVGAALLVASVLGGWAWHPALGLVMLTYAVLQVGYLSGLKDQPAIDLAVVSSGFLLRAVAGGVATQTPLSPWFLLVATFGALFVVTGKRYSEMSRLGASAGTRPSLRHYSASYLRFVWTMAAGVTVTVYLLWALNGPGAATRGIPWAALSVAPFVLCLLRYAARVDQGEAEHPEEIVLGDRHLQVVAAVWVSLVVAGAVLT